MDYLSQDSQDTQIFGRSTWKLVDREFWLIMTRVTRYTKFLGDLLESWLIENLSNHDQSKFINVIHHNCIYIYIYI